MISVERNRDGDIVIKNDSSVNELVLKPHQAIYLLKKLADELGYKVTVSKPVIRFKLEALSTIRVWMIEGKQSRTFVIPLDIILSYVAVLKSIKNESRDKVSKREVVGHVINKLTSKYKELEKYFKDGDFDWEKFFGSRTDYYTYFHVPVLILEKLGFIKLTSRSIVIKDTVLSINDEQVKKALPK